MEFSAVSGMLLPELEIKLKKYFVSIKYLKIFVLCNDGHCFKSDILVDRSRKTLGVRILEKSKNGIITLPC